MKQFAAKAGLLGCVLLCVNISIAEAGPCTDDIAKFEAERQQNAGSPGAGLTAQQSVGAQLEHQPTRGSVQRAEERLRSKFAARMARAKRLDASGDRAGCTSALSAAKRMYIP